MCIPKFSAGASAYISTRSYAPMAGREITVDGTFVVPQQKYSLTTADKYFVDLPGVVKDPCRRELQLCQAWCGKTYAGGTKAYSDCLDDCDIGYQNCKNRMRNPDYDPFVDRMNPIPMRSKPLPFGSR